MEGFTNLDSLYNGLEEVEETEEWVAWQLRFTFGVQAHALFERVDVTSMRPDEYAPTVKTMPQIWSQAIALTKKKNVALTTFESAVVSAREVVYTPAAVAVASPTGSIEKFDNHRGCFMSAKDLKTDIDARNLIRMSFAAYKPVKVKETGKFRLEVRDPTGSIAPCAALTPSKELLSLVADGANLRDVYKNIDRRVSEFDGKTKLYHMLLFPHYRDVSYKKTGQKKGWASVMEACSHTKAPLTSQVQAFAKQCGFSTVDYTPSYARMPSKVLGGSFLDVQRFIQETLKISRDDPLYEDFILGTLPSSIHRTAVAVANVAHLKSKLDEKNAMYVYLEGIKADPAYKWNFNVIDVANGVIPPSGSTVLVLDKLVRTAASNSRTGVVQYTPEYSEVVTYMKTRERNFAVHFKRYECTVKYVCLTVPCEQLLSQYSYQLPLTLAFGEVWLYTSGKGKKNPSAMVAELTRMMSMAVVHRVTYPFHRVPYAAAVADKLRITILRTSRVKIDEVGVAVCLDDEVPSVEIDTEAVGRVLDDVKPLPTPASYVADEEMFGLDEVQSAQLPAVDFASLEFSFNDTGL